MAELYRQQRRHDESESLYRLAVEAQERSLGPRHTDLSDTLNGLGLLYLRSDRLDAAADPLERALAIRRAALAPGHHDVYQSLNNVAMLRRAQGACEDARQLADEAIELVRRSPDAHPRSTFFISRNLVGIHTCLEDWQRVVDTYRTMIGVLDTAFPPGHPLVDATLRDYASLLRERGRGAEAAAIEARLAPQDP